MSIHFNPFSSTHQANQPINQDSNISEGQIADLVNNLGSATIASAACFQSSSVGSLNKEIVYKLYKDEYRVECQELCVKALGKDSYVSEKGSCTIDLKTSLPEALKQEGYKEYATILDLLGYKFPLLTQSLFKKETEIPRFIVSFLHSKSELLSLQIKAKGEIVFISSDSWTVKKPEKYTYNISFGLEEKVTIIGVLIAEQEYTDLFEDLLKSRKVPYRAYNSSSYEGNCRCLPRELLCKELAKRPYVSKDRERKIGETLHPFCLEVVPQLF